jgi:uncharacterized protein YecE (DUF72 family)
MLASLYIGTAGWNVPKAVAAEFPGSGAHLQRYAQVMNGAEINSSFYRTHKPETWRKWAAAVPAHFRFSIKAPKTVTHAGTLELSPELATFLDAVTELGPKRGPILFQLPPRLNLDDAHVRTFLSRLRSVYDGPVVFEPRHVSWFTETGSELLAEARVARVAADPPRCEEGAVPGGYSALRYYRLHGSPRVYFSRYERAYLARLADQLQNDQAEVWCIFDNTASGAAIENALELQRLIRPVCSGAASP